MKVADNPASTASPATPTRTIARAVDDVGAWAWKNKADIGFWTGTAALIASVPLAGGGAGRALSGGKLATLMQGAATRVGASGRFGSAAVGAARSGVASLKSASSAVANTRVGSAVGAARDAIHAGRLKVGDTSVGRGLMKAGQPLGVVGSGIALVNLGDTVGRATRGEAHAGDVALATLAAAPAGTAVVKSLAAGRAATVNAQAASVVSQRLDGVVERTATASTRASQVSYGAPKVNAPQTAQLADDAQQTAASASAQARSLQDQVGSAPSPFIAVFRPNAGASAPSATALANQLDDVLATTRSAQSQAGQAAAMAPTASLTNAAADAGERLHEAARIGSRVSRDVRGLAQQQRAADLVVKVADDTKRVLGMTSLHTGLATNTTRVITDPVDHGQDRGLASNLANVLLKLTARGRAG